MYLPPKVYVVMNKALEGKPPPDFLTMVTPHPDLNLPENVLNLLKDFFYLSDPQCEDNLPEDCASLFARDKEYCKTHPEYMKENCARTCQYCGMIHM